MCVLCLDNDVHGSCPALLSYKQSTALTALTMALELAVYKLFVDRPAFFDDNQVFTNSACCHSVYLGSFHKPVQPLPDCWLINYTWNEVLHSEMIIRLWISSLEEH